MGEYLIREIEPRDAESYVACHRKVFAETGGKTQDEWKWAFADNPSGPRAFVALHEGQVVAAYAGIAQRTWIGGRERPFVQIVDSMVDPEHRRGLKRPGLYVEVGERFFDAYGGEGGDVVFYGWPMDQALRIGRRFLDYRLVREELALVRELGEPNGEPTPDEVELLTTLGEDLKWLWDRCAGHFGAATIRDEAWARWRFFGHPFRRYTLLGVRREGILRGLAVLREGRWIWPGAMALCDWLVPPDEPDVAELLERAITDRARAAEMDRVIAVIPDWSTPFAEFQERGWRVFPSPYSLTARSFDRRFDLGWLRENWWYTLADSDLV